MFIQKLIHKLKRKLGIRSVYPSETSKVRHLVIGYCTGYGCDIGFGGDKITRGSIGIDFASPYAHTGKDKVDIACDVINDEIPLPDNTFDYVYTSHLIEDFENTKQGLEKFIRVLKNEGLLILVFPDQKMYELHCKRTGQPLNAYHKHADMGLHYMLHTMEQMESMNFQIIFKSDREIDYNVILVAKIFKNGQNKTV
jgi:ubiquinone/menaquinone biosynthesis C-methylase UbiE